MTRRTNHPGARRATRASRRGFTALELMMATAIGAVVLLAAMGVFGMMERMDRFQSDRFREASDTAFAHTIVRRAMQTMVAKAPIDSAEMIERSTGISRDEARPREERPDDGNNALRDEMAKRFNPMLHGLQGQYKDDRGKNEPLTLDGFGRVIFPKSMFVLEPSGVLTTSNANAPSRLELTMLAQPAPGAPASALFVRGAFEVEPRRKGWALVYRPILPEGEPIDLLDGVMALEWQVLVRGDEAGKSLFTRNALGRGQPENDDKGGVWKAAISAETPAEFPKAIRLRALLSTGRSIDWLFEPSITTGGVQ